MSELAEHNALGFQPNSAHMGALLDCLTEYDDSVGSELKIDPLGMLVIWSELGQKIFRRRVSSIANDVRNYTLNLFNHWVVRAAINDDTLVLGAALAKRYTSKHDLKLKYAILIYLENLFVYSLLYAQGEQQQSVTTVGVLGINNAGRQWHQHEQNPTLVFSDEPHAQVLVRQLYLGVSGRYKTPLVELGFFDRNYQATSPTAEPLWAKVSALVRNTPTLRRLESELIPHLREVLGASRAKETSRPFSEVPTALKQAWAEAFPSPRTVGKYARAFWLAATELDQGAVGAIYRAITTAKKVQGLHSPSVAEVFTRAAAEPLLRQEQSLLNHVLQVEPLLAEVDLLFTLMLSKPEQSLKELEQGWKALGRNGKTLAQVSKPLAETDAVISALPESGRMRLKTLVAIAQHTNVPAQARALFEYHQQVMQRRDQDPWLTLSGDRLLLKVAPRRAPTQAERPLGSWVNPYYVPQFRHLLNGLLGDQP